MRNILHNTKGIQNKTQFQKKKPNNDRELIFFNIFFAHVYV